MIVDKNVYNKIILFAIYCKYHSYYLLSTGNGFNLLSTEDNLISQQLCSVITQKQCFFSVFITSLSYATCVPIGLGPGLHA